VVRPPVRARQRWQFQVSGLYPFLCLSSSFESVPSCFLCMSLHLPAKFSKFAPPIPNQQHPWIHHLPSLIPDPTPSRPGSQDARDFKSRGRCCSR
jgi:hypothetical protein